MKYNRSYPIKVWLTGLLVISLFASLMPARVGVKENTQMTLDDFSPLFVTFFMIAFVFLPVIIAFYISFFLLERKAVGYIKAKIILMIVSCISGFLMFAVLDGGALTLKTLMMILVYLLPVISGIAYYKLSADIYPDTNV